MEDRTAATDRPVTLALVGDVMLGRMVDAAIAARGFGYPWGDVLPILQRADLFLINLECALTSHQRRWRDGQGKAFYFRSDPSAVQTLKIGGVDFACLANNHAEDFEADGLLETIRVLDEAGIAHAGAGSDAESARAPAQLRVDSQRIQVLAFADHPQEWAAALSSPGINHTPVSLAPAHFSKIEGAVAAAHQLGGPVIFSIHWGPNMRSRPSSAFGDFARRVVATGADIFWGHSAHVVQGIEWWHGRPILYDTGDFLDDYAVDLELRNDLSAVFLVRMRPPRVEGIEVVPVQISRMRVNLARGTEREWFLRRFTSLCAEMGTEVVVDARQVLVPPPERQEARAGR